MPPYSAALLTCDGGAAKIGSLLGPPTIGMPQWICGSMPPGMTICPVASTVRPAPTAARLPGAPIAAIFPPETPISAASVEAGMTAVPPVMIRSNMSPPSSSTRKWVLMTHSSTVNRASLLQKWWVTSNTRTMPNSPHYSAAQSEFIKETGEPQAKRVRRR